jgi:FkbM family methyltransferase
VFGTSININPADTIGLAIYQTGLYDLALTEMIFRLVHEGDTTVDVGANIGYVTQLMSKKAGANGKTFCIEPNPFVLDVLTKNIEALSTKDNVTLLKIAMSNFTGTAPIVFPNGYEGNKGLAQIGDADTAGDCMVHVSQLCDLGLSTIDVLKIDAEGHELKILQGAQTMLGAGKIAHIVYEDFGAYPTPIYEYLKSFGYAIFRLEKGWLGPTLKYPATPHKIQYWETINYVATIDEAKLKAVMKFPFYKCFRANN